MEISIPTQNASFKCALATPNSLIKPLSEGKLNNNHAWGVGLKLFIWLLCVGVPGEDLLPSQTEAYSPGDTNDSDNDGKNYNNHVQDTPIYAK